MGICHAQGSSPRGARKVRGVRLLLLSHRAVRWRLTSERVVGLGLAWQGQVGPLPCAESPSGLAAPAGPAPTA